MTTVICKHHKTCLLECNHNSIHDHGPACIDETYRICKGECLTLDWLQIEQSKEKVDGKTNILVIGTYPHLKKWHPADDAATYGYLVLRDHLHEKVYGAEETYHKALGTDLPSNHIPELKAFLKDAFPYAVGANFDTWRTWMYQMIG